MRPSISRLHERLVCDPESGILVWKVTGLPQWDAKYIGMEASQIRPNGYKFLCIDKINNLRAHHVVWAMVYGRWPNRRIDHKDRNPLNNAISNLREATRSQNGANSRRPITNNSGFKGVSRSGRPSRPWAAHIKVDQKTKFLGRYVTPEEAHEAYKTAATRVFGEFARFA